MAMEWNAQLITVTAAHNKTANNLVIQNSFNMNAITLLIDDVILKQSFYLYM